MTRDATGRRFAVGDVVVTTKRSWYGPGIVGEVITLNGGTVTLETDLTIRRRITVRCDRVLIVERRSGTAVRLRKSWNRLRELRNR